MQWSRESWSPHSSAFYCLYWGKQPLLAVQTSRGVCFSCCFSTQRTSLCDLLSFWRFCQWEGDWWTGTSHFLPQTEAVGCHGFPPCCNSTHHWVRTALCSWNRLILFALLVFIPFSLSLLTPTFACWRSYCAMCSPSSPCSSRAVVMLGRGGSLGSSGHWGAGKAVLSLSQPSRGASTVGARCWESLGGAFVSTCHGAELWGVCALPFLRQNKYISAFWHWFLTKDSRNCSCSGFLVPSPTLLQCCCSEILNSAINNLLYQQHAFALFEMVLWGR